MTGTQRGRCRENSLSVRPATEDEGSDLTELALRAKSHWGYDANFLDTARADLTIDAEKIRSARIYVLEDRGRTIGFYGLLGDPPRGRLEWMFLEPETIGRGYGRWLWKNAMERATAAGFAELTIESDRYAEAFYLAMGATRIGRTTSPVDGALLPLLRVEIERPAIPSGELGCAVSGIVQAGRGLGAGLMSDGSVLTRLRELAGFPILPGTLNLRLGRPLARDASWHYLPASEISPDWEARSGQAGYFLARVMVANRYRGLAFQAVEPGYPSDQIEVCSGVRLRDALGLMNGDPVTVSLWPKDESWLRPA